MVENTQKGFILIDSIIAVAIIVVVFGSVGGIVGMFTQAKSSGRMANNNLIAYNLAQARLEELNRSNIAWNEVSAHDDTAVQPVNMTTDPGAYPTDLSNIDTASENYTVSGRTETLPLKNSTQIFTRVTRAFPVTVDSNNSLDYINPQNSNKNDHLIQVIVTVSWNENAGGQTHTNKVTTATLHDIAQE